MLRLALVTLAAAMFSTGASASCALSSGPCSTDSYGNTYRTQQSLGGGYSTNRNGSPYSTTNQNLGGGYTESYSSGGSRTYNSNPYGSSFGSSSGSRRY